jgi:hypothetical protein
MFLKIMAVLRKEQRAMYDFVNRPVTLLNRGGRLPMAALARALANVNILPAAPVFDPDCTRFSND